MSWKCIFLWPLNPYEISVFRSPESILFPKPITFEALHKKTMEKHIVQYIKNNQPNATTTNKIEHTVSASAWPSWLPDFGIPYANAVPGFPTRTINWHSKVHLHTFVESLPALTSVFLDDDFNVMPLLGDNPAL